MAAADDPQRRIAQSPMTWRQGLAVAACVGLNALDGFDVLSISFASPGIAAEWGIDRAALGIVLSVELIGMAFGAILLGQVADRVGRRPTVLACLLAMAAGMALSAQVDSVGMLAASRLFTGFAIGGVLATTNALVAEYSNDRRRGAAVALMAAGYPLGAVLGGSVASALLVSGGWRDVFTFGALATLAFLPVAYWLLPEPVGALIQRRPHDALDRVNATLRRLGQPTVDALPAPNPSGTSSSGGFRRLLSPAFRVTTFALTMAYFLHIMTFYFTVKWVPKIVADMGFSPASAGQVLVWANVGGLIGSLAFILLTLRIAPRLLVIAAMLGAAVFVVLFGRGQADLAGLSWAVGAAGLFSNAAIVGLYALIAAAYPAAVRAGGTGFVIGFGRGGAALGPVVGGFLFQAGFGLPVVTIAMALGSVIAAAILFTLRPSAHSH